MNDQSFYSGHFKLQDLKSAPAENIGSLTKGTLLVLKPNFQPAILLGNEQNNKLSVFLMGDK